MSKHTSPVEGPRAIQVFRAAVVAGLNRRERVAALGAALDVSGGEEADRIAQVLVADAVDDQWVAMKEWPRLARWLWRLGMNKREQGRLAAGALARNWGRLGHETRREILNVASGPLRRAAHAGLREGSARARAGASELIGDAGWMEFAPDLGRLAGDADEEVTRGVERGLRGLVAHGEHGAAALRAALAAAVSTWREHRRDGVLHAAMECLDPAAVAFGGRDEALTKWFLDGRSESHMGLRSVMRRTPGALSRVRAWQWLGRNVMAVAALERVAAAKTEAEHEEVLRRAHLVANPVRARRLALTGTKERELAGLWPASGVAGMSLSEGARRGLVQFVTATPVAEEQRRRVLEPLIADPSARVRLAALGATERREALDYCFDPEEPVARVAANRCGPVGGVALWRKLSRSPHASVRRMSREELERADPWRADSEWSREAARAELARDRAAFVAEVRRRIGAGGAGGGPERIGALMLARRLGLARDIELELLAIAASESDEGLVATAVAALGEVGSDAARQVIAACLAHSSGRVRGNAAEALRRASAGEAVLQKLVELKSDQDHRARSTAIRELLRGPGSVDATEDLAAMLRDTRPLHRLAGLWAVERLAIGAAPGSGSPVAARWGEFASLVAKLTREEPEAPVRERAERCGARMLARVRLMWQDRAPVFEEGAGGGEP